MSVKIVEILFFQKSTLHRAQGARAGKGLNELNQEVRHHQGHSLDHFQYLDKSQNLGP